MKAIKIPVFIIFLFLTSFGFSQTAVSSYTDSLFLMKLSDTFNERYKREKEIALQFAKDRDIPVRISLEDGREMELQYIGEDGFPVYYQTLNAGAAKTTAVSSLYPGGSLRLFLTGKGYYAGVWDSGRIDYLHDEFGGRVSIKDGASTNTQHATHVAGTVIAAGIQPSARGMAYEGKVHGYDWNNDNSEMAAAAASGLLISNHSYGIVLGWNYNNGSWQWTADPDSTRDYRFGFYSGASRSLDQIAFSAPYYTIVWAAGNDRSDAGDGSRPPDGPYDCIGPEGVAKNVLAIGAVGKIPGGYSNPSDVSMTSFSSWGPVDDGRVKPDFVAAGANLYSTTPNNSYGSLSGTSMAAPNATGSLLMLQQLYAMQNQDAFMKAATLKALAIHTVNQAGTSPGPDYQHGWGLLNIEKASRLINHRDQVDFFISENTLAQGGVYELQFEADGTGDIVATIAWTDPPGQPVAAAMNPRNPMLVNDLDMRIFNPDGTEFFPWQLDPDSPATLPLQTDNFRDNVEKILIQNPQAGTYTLQITHKGQLVNGQQAYSLCLQTRDIPTRNTYYWVGNSGSWSDPGNWSLTSGGTPVETFPTSDDHVVFDANSFSGSETFNISLEEDAGCYSFNWETEVSAVLSLNDHTLEIQSSFFHTQPGLVTDTPGTLAFSSNMKNNVVYLPLGFGEAATFRFDNENGSWKFLSDLNAYAIEILGGEVDLSGKQIQVSRLTIEGELDKTLNLNLASVQGLSFVDFDNEALTIDLEGADLLFNGPGEETPKFLKGGGRAFDQVENAGGTLIVEGNNRFWQLKNDSQLELAGPQTITHLHLDPGAVLILAGGTVQEIELSFAAAGAAGQMITIAADADESAMLHCDYNAKFCNDYLDISNVSVSGIAVFGAGLNSVIEGNADGWIQQDCEDILFADFSAQFTCVNALVFFHDQSSGMVTDWLWNFNLDDPLEPSSTKSDPYYIYTETGTYDVSLQVTDGVYTHTGIKPVIITENPFNRPVVNVQGNTYTSSLSAPNYQWFRNGEPIPGATSRVYTNADETPGQYQVMIFNQTCNRISEPYNFNYTSIAQNDQINFSVFPNPAKDFFVIDLPSNQGSAMFLEVFNIHGTLLYQEKIQNGASGQKRIETASMLPGVYFLRLTIDGATSIKKVLVL